MDLDTRAKAPSPGLLTQSDLSPEGRGGARGAILPATTSPFGGEVGPIGPGEGAFLPYAITLPVHGRGWRVSAG
jgi:hypothetical protein